MAKTTWIVKQKRKANQHSYIHKKEIVLAGFDRGG